MLFLREHERACLPAVGWPGSYGSTGLIGGHRPLQALRSLPIISLNCAGWVKNISAGWVENIMEVYYARQ